MPSLVLDLVGNMGAGNAQPQCLQKYTDLFFNDDVLVRLTSLLSILSHTLLIHFRSRHAAPHVNTLSFTHDYSHLQEDDCFTCALPQA